MSTPKKPDLAALAGKVLEKDDRNIMEKAAKGRALTARERARMESISAAEVGVDFPPKFEKTWDDLALALGTTRRAIQEWKKDPRYSGDCPRDRADGRKEVAAWSRFMVRHNLKRAAEHIDDSDLSTLNSQLSTAADVVHPPRLAGSQADWQKALIREKHETARLDRLTTEGTLLVATELEVPLGATFATIQTKLSQFPARVARYLVGLRDVGEIEDKLRDEIDADLRDLQAGRFTDEQAIAAAVAALPWDEASEAALKFVTFDGQDRAALLALVTSVATQALRLLGRQSIALTRDASPAPAAAPADQDAEPDLPAHPESGPAAASRRDRSPDTADQPGPAARSASEKSRKPGKSEVKKKQRSRKSKPVTIPPAIEGAIYAEPRKKTRRRGA